MAVRESAKLCGATCGWGRLKASQGDHGSGDGGGMVAASGQLGSVARHQTPQSDIPSSQSLHHLEPFEESLTGRSSLETPRGSKSIAGRDMAALDRFGGLACQTMEAGPKGNCQ